MKKKHFIIKLTMSLCASLFTVLTLMFFAPMDVFLGNINAFTFSLGEILPTLLAFCGTAVLVSTLIGTVIPYTASVIYNTAVFAFGICCYVQSAFLNGKMVSLTGDEIVFSPATVYGNLAVWGILAVAIIVFSVVTLIKKKDTWTVNAVRFLSLALVVMQLTAFVSGVVTREEKNTDIYLSGTGEFELSHKQNTVVFILDSFDTCYVSQTLEKFPNLYDGLDGFTYYSNTTSTHSRTYPSIPYLLTGTMCYFDVPYGEYIENAYSSSTFMQDIKATGCDIGLYTDQQYVSPQMKGIVSNCQDRNDLSVKKFGLIKQMAKISLLRNMPYKFKLRFLYDNATINNGVVEIPSNCIASQDITFYNTLKNEKLTVSDKYDKAFRFYHFWGAHSGGNWNENMEPVESSDYPDRIAGCFKIVKEYINMMKEANIYDESTIIITTDHGMSVGGWDNNLVLDKPQNPILYIKAPNATGKLAENSAPVCHGDLFATILYSFGGNTEKYGKTVYDWNEDDERTRYYYHSALFSDTEGEVALREYEIKGDANDINNWRLTGKNWDINYSERAVSPRRLAEVMDTPQNQVH